MAWWGPYLSERQWGTVREDYSEGGDAWNYFTHDQARSRAYRWGEDGLAGISDDQQQLCLRAGPVERQGPDPQGAAVRADQQRGQSRRGRQGVLLLPRLTPTHSYLKYLYKYPQAAFPYDDLVRPTAAAGRDEFEYELIDTGVFDDDRYFDVFVEYAKASPEDILIQITVHNRGPDAGDAPRPADAVVPQHLVVGRTAVRAGRSCGRSPVAGQSIVEARRIRNLGERVPRTAMATPTLLFTENETNTQRLFGVPTRRRTSRTASTTTWCMAGRDAVNPHRTGTKVAAHYRLDDRAGRVGESFGCG